MKFFNWFFEIPRTGRTLAVALFFALLFRSVISAPYKIPTGSMIPTLKIGDFIFVNKLAYGLKIPFTNKNLITYDSPKRGEVIVFIFPNEPDKDYIKRVVAVAGDVVDIKNDALYINGQEIAKRPFNDKDILSDLQDYEMSDSDLFIEDLSGTRHMIRETPSRRHGANGICPTQARSLEAAHNCDPYNPGPFTIQEGHVFAMGDNRDDSLDSRYWGEVPLSYVRGKALMVWLSFNPKHALFKLFGVEVGKPRLERFGMQIL